GDGKQDLAVTNFSDNNVSVLLGKGDGTFAAPVSFAAGKSPTSVAMADFNGDGKPDLAVANGGDRNVSVLLGNGDGTFGPAVNFAADGYPYYVRVADFNGDGHPDLVVADGTAGFSPSQTVSVLLGKGDGTFRSAVNFGVGTNPRSVVV